MLRALLNYGELDVCFASIRLYGWFRFFVFFLFVFLDHEVFLCKGVFRLCSTLFIWDAVS